MSVTPIKSRTAASAADPPRRALRQALDVQRQAAAAIERQEAAIKATRTAVFAAKRDLEKAKEGIAEAMEEAAAEIAAAAAGGSPVPSSGAVRRARDAERDAEDRIATMEAALAKLKADHALCQQAAEAAAADVQVAINTILAEHVRPLLAKAQHLRDELTPLIAVLAGLWREPAAGVAHGDSFDEVRRGAALLFAQLKHLGTAWQTTDASLRQEARAALIADPDAELPDALRCSS